VFLIVTVLIIFKKERNSELEEDDQIKIDIIQSYKLLWDIFKIKHMKLLLMAILTSMVNMFIKLFSGKLDHMMLANPISQLKYYTYYYYNRLSIFINFIKIYLLI